MRIAFFAIALVIAAPVTAQTVNETFDRISGERTLAYTADGSMDTARPVFTFEAILVGDASSASIRLAFVSANAPRFAACHDIAWFVDGRSLTAEPASYRGSVVDGEMIELIDQNVTPSWATAIANAQDARYRVCRNEYAFSARDIEAFGRIANKLNGATLTSATQAGDPTPAPAAAKPVDYKGMNWRPKNQQSLFPTRN